jgi:NADP-dependent 3-hydroxy acid dehydrogenase YdfG
MNEIFSIEGKVAVISGACGVLGGSIARSFIQAGAKIVAIGTNREKLEKTLEKFAELG